MKVISLWQPWASLIAWGDKEYETRSWKPHGLKRGDAVAIHAAKRFTKEEREYCHQPHFREAMQRHAVTPDDLPLGAVLCIAQLIGCYRVEDVRDGLTPKERAFGNYQNGRFAWQFKVIHVFDEPIPAKGAQGIWDWEPPLTEDVTPEDETTTDTRFESALNVALKVAAMLKPHTERIQIAGSVRRKKPNPKDIEILVIPTPTLWPFVDELLAMGHIGKATYGATKQTRWGEKYRGLQYDGMKVEIFTATPETWGNQLLIRTGPGDANQRLMQILNRHTPLRFKDGAVWYSENWRKDGNGWEADDKQHIPLCEESDVFRLLGMDFVEPEARHERMYDVLSKPTHVWPDARQFLTKVEATEMFAGDVHYNAELHVKMSTIVDKKPPFVWPEELKLSDGRVIVPRKHGWTICRETDPPAMEYAQRFQRGVFGWNAEQLAWDARRCRWMNVKEKVRDAPPETKP